MSKLIDIKRQTGTPRSGYSPQAGIEFSVGGVTDYIPKCREAPA